MHRTRLLTACIALAASLAAASPAGTAQQRAAAGAKAVASYGKYEFSLATLDGKNVKLSDYAGKVVLVNIWAPWCGPCKKETPGFANLYAAYRAKGFEILGVAVQTNENDVRAFVQKYKTSWPIGIKDEVARNYGTYGLPDTYLFRPDGSLVKRFIGYAAEEALRPLIEEALKAVPASKQKSR